MYFISNSQTFLRLGPVNQLWESLPGDDMQFWASTSSRNSSESVIKIAANFHGTLCETKFLLLLPNFFGSIFLTFF